MRSEALFLLCVSVAVVRSTPAYNFLKQANALEKHLNEAFASYSAPSYLDHLKAPRCELSDELADALLLSKSHAETMCEYVAADTDKDPALLEGATRLLSSLTAKAKIAVLCCDYEYAPTRGDARGILAELNEGAVGYKIISHKVEGLTFEAIQRGPDPATGRYPASEFRLVRGDGTPDAYWQKNWDALAGRSGYRQVKHRHRDGYFEAADYSHGLVYRYEPEVVKEKTLAAIKHVEKRGVQGIAFDVGYSQQFQASMAGMTDTPVMLSSMGQLSLISQYLVGDPSRRVMVVTANAETFNIPTMIPSYIMPPELVERHVVVVGMEDNLFGQWVAGGKSFSRLKKYATDSASVEEALPIVVGAALRAKQDIERDGGRLVAVVLECTELPAYTNALRHSLNVPVYDALTNIDWLSGQRAALFSAFMPVR